jgi:predicted transcriptional regulator
MPFDAAEWLTSDEAISASWATYQETGRHLPGQEVRTWLNTWGTENESTVPECHK